MPLTRHHLDRGAVVALPPDASSAPRPAALGVLRMGAFLVVSLIGHTLVSLFAALIVLVIQARIRPTATEAPAAATPAGVWSGTTAELPGHGALYDVSVEGPTPGPPPIAAAPAEPSPPAADPETPAAVAAPTPPIDPPEQPRQTKTETLKAAAPRQKVMRLCYHVPAAAS